MTEYLHPSAFFNQALSPSAFSAIMSTTPLSYTVDGTPVYDLTASPRKPPAWKFGIPPPETHQPIQYRDMLALAQVKGQLALKVDDYRKALGHGHMASKLGAIERVTKTVPALDRMGVYYIRP
jgi:hypothetical protein